MNRLQLKVAGCVGLVVAVIVTVRVLWPGQAPIAESKDTEQVEKHQHKLEGRAGVQQPQARDSAGAARSERGLPDKRLSRMASFQRKSDKLAVANYSTAGDSYPPIMMQHPINLRGGKAERLPQKVPAQYREHFNVTGGNTSAGNMTREAKKVLAFRDKIARVSLRRHRLSGGQAG